MARPFVLLQLSDLHIGATWSDGAPAERLGTAIECVAQLPDAPDAILISGDIAETGADSEYEEAKRLLDRLDAPCYVLPGNHDRRQTLRGRFELCGEPGAPINYFIDLGPLRLVVLDSTRPGHDGGELDADRLDWLDRALSAAADQPTLVAMHHPPLLTGEPAWDRIGMPSSDQQALGRLLEGHEQVCLLIGGHIHRTIISRLSERTVLAAPAIYGASLPDFTGEELKIVDGRPAFVVHAMTDGALTSHVHAV
jgi:3',5'-cyclic-AMP phosphodiesterase